MNAAIQTDRHRCYYCDIPISANPPHGSTIRSTKDHIIPKSRGGGSHDDNIVLCCGTCNFKKGSKSLTQYYRDTNDPKKKERIANLLGYVFEQGNRLYLGRAPKEPKVIELPPPKGAIIIYPPSDNFHEDFVYNGIVY